EDGGQPTEEAVQVERPRRLGPTAEGLGLAGDRQAPHHRRRHERPSHEPGGAGDVPGKRCRRCHENDYAAVPSAMAPPRLRVGWERRRRHGRLATSPAPPPTSRATTAAGVAPKPWATAAAITAGWSGYQRP